MPKILSPPTFWQPGNIFLHGCFIVKCSLIVNVLVKYLLSSSTFRRIEKIFLRQCFSWLQKIFLSRHFGDLRRYLFLDVSTKYLLSLSTFQWKIFVPLRHTPLSTTSNIFYSLIHALYRQIQIFYSPRYTFYIVDKGYFILDETLYIGIERYFLLADKLCINEKKYFQYLVVFPKIWTW